MAQKIVIIAGSNRTGTSAVAKILYENGFCIQCEGKGNKEYRTYEDIYFKAISKQLRKGKAVTLNYPIEENIVYKYPKASFVINEWVKTFPNAKFIYVLREPRTAIWRQIQHFAYYFLPLWLKYWREYNEGYAAMMGIENLYIISYERLQKFPELEKRKLLGFALDSEVGLHNR